MIMTEDKKEVIVNHVAELAKKKGYVTKSRFLAEAESSTGISRNTLLKAYDGATDLSIETVIGLAKFFGVQFKDVLEIKI